MFKINCQPFTKKKSFIFTRYINKKTSFLLVYCIMWKNRNPCLIAMKFLCIASANFLANSDSPPGSKNPNLRPNTNAQDVSNPSLPATSSKSKMVSSPKRCCLNKQHQSSAISSTCGRNPDIVLGLVKSEVNDVLRWCQTKPKTENTSWK